MENGKGMLEFEPKPLFNMKYSTLSSISKKIFH